MVDVVCFECGGIFCVVGGYQGGIVVCCICVYLGLEDGVIGVQGGVVQWYFVFVDVYYDCCVVYGWCDMVVQFRDQFGEMVVDGFGCIVLFDQFEGVFQFGEVFEVVVYVM